MQTCNTPNRYPIYRHGYWARIELLLPSRAHSNLVEAEVDDDDETAVAELRGIGWTGRESSDWREDGRNLFSLKGSKGLTGRRAKETNLLGKRNKEWGTKLYHLGVEFHGDKFYLHIKSVRAADLVVVCEGILGLRPRQYKLDYYRRLERYVVLAPPEAHRLAAELGGRDRHGKGTQSPIRFLLQKKEIPIRLGRARRTIKIKIYRVEKGATSPYRVEAWMEGTREQHDTLQDEHVDVLDEFLSALVAEHDLHPLEKPALWEPRSTSTFQWDRDLRKLPLRASKGVQRTFGEIQPLVDRSSAVMLVSGARNDGLEGAARLSPRSLGSSSLSWWREGDEATTHCSRRDVQDDEHHLQHDDRQGDGLPDADPSVPTLSSGQDGDATANVVPAPDLEPIPSDARERIDRYLACREAMFAHAAEQAASAPHPSTVPANQADRPDGPVPPDWAVALVTDLQDAHDGSIHEIVLDGNEDPTVVVNALRAAYGPEGVGVHHLGLPDDMWHGIENIMQAPAPDDPVIDVVIVDPDAVLALDPDRWAKECRHCGRHPSESVPRALEAILWGPLREARKAAERDGGKLVFVTADARSDHGRGHFRNRHYSTDARVRSILGDAIRYYAHQRYYVEPHGRVVCWKDEKHGRTGRIVFDNLPVTSLDEFLDLDPAPMPRRDYALGLDTARL